MKSSEHREQLELGSIENPIIDSQLTRSEALRQNPERPAPPEIMERQRVVTVKYLGFDHKYHQGQIVVDQALASDVEELFTFMRNLAVPIEKVIPIADKKFCWDDNASMDANNSSGFNFRTIAGATRLSYHAQGRAIDLNPMLNPWDHHDKREPAGSNYDPSQPGTWSPDSPVVIFMKSRGWTWGGEFVSMKDYHHFQKPQE